MELLTNLRTTLNWRDASIITLSKEVPIKQAAEGSIDMSRALPSLFKQKLY